MKTLQCFATLISNISFTVTETMKIYRFNLIMSNMIRIDTYDMTLIILPRHFMLWIQYICNIKLWNYAYFKC